MNQEMAKVARMQDKKMRGERHDRGMKNGALDDATPLETAVEKNGSEPIPLFRDGITANWIDVGSLSYEREGEI